MTEALIDLSRQILVLKSKLGELSDTCIAARICWYCSEWGNIKNKHKSSGQYLAQQFLQEINGLKH